MKTYFFYFHETELPSSLPSFSLYYWRLSSTLWTYILFSLSLLVLSEKNTASALIHWSQSQPKQFEIFQKNPFKNTNTRGKKPAQATEELLLMTSLHWQWHCTIVGECLQSVPPSDIVMELCCCIYVLLDSLRTSKSVMPLTRGSLICTHSLISGL